MANKKKNEVVNDVTETVEDSNPPVPELVLFTCNVKTANVAGCQFTNFSFRANPEQAERLRNLKPAGDSIMVTEGGDAPEVQAPAYDIQDLVNQVNACESDESLEALLEVFADRFPYGTIADSDRTILKATIDAKKDKF